MESICKKNMRKEVVGEFCDLSLLVEGISVTEKEDKRRWVLDAAGSLGRSLFKAHW